MAAKDINAIVRELAAVRSPDERDRLIAERLLAMTAALGVSVSRFEPHTGKLRVGHLAASPKVLETVRQLLGQSAQTLDLRPGAFFEQILRGPQVVELHDLREIFFGQVPDEVPTQIEHALNIGRVYGLVFRHEQELMGTATVFLSRDSAGLDLDTLRAFAEAVSAVLPKS